MAQGMGMFGPSVDDVRAQIQQENTPQYSDDWLKSSAALGRQSAYGLAESFGGGDPRIVKAKKIKEIVDDLRQSGVDVSNPGEFYPEMIKRLSAAGMSSEAEAMRTKFGSESMEMSLKQAQTIKYLAEAKKAGREKDPEIVQLQRALQEAIADGKTEEAKQISDLIAKKVAPDNGPEYAQILKMYEDEVEANGPESSKAKALKKRLDNMVPDSYGDTFTQRVGDKTVVLQKNDKTGKISTIAGDQPNITNINSSTGPKAFLDYVKIREKFLDEVKKPDETLTTVKDLTTLLDLAKDSPLSAAAARNTIAKVFRVDSQNAKSEIERLINTGSLPSRVVQSLNLFLAGTLTQDQVKDTLNTLRDLEKRARADRDNVAAQYRNLPGMEEDGYKFVTGGGRSADTGPAVPALPKEGVTKSGIRYKIEGQ